MIFLELRRYVDWQHAHFECHLSAARLDERHQRRNAYQPMTAPNTPCQYLAAPPHCLRALYSNAIIAHAPRRPLRDGFAPSANA